MTNTPTPDDDRGEPNWQPISAVAMLTAVVAEQLDHTRSQLALMEQARPSRPNATVLDDHTVAETLRVYGVMADDYRDLFAQQGIRWQNTAGLTAAQRTKVDAFVALVAEHRALPADILALTREIEPWTIEKVMAMDDAELGLAALLGSFGSFHGRTQT